MKKVLASLLISIMTLAQPITTARAQTNSAQFGGASIAVSRYQQWGVAGTYSFKADHSGLYWLIAVGPGGTAAIVGGAGAGGSYGACLVYLSSGTTETVTIATSGSATSIGSLVSSPSGGNASSGTGGSAGASATFGTACLNTVTYVGGSGGTNSLGSGSGGGGGGAPGTPYGVGGNGANVNASGPGTGAGATGNGVAYTSGSSQGGFIGSNASAATTAVNSTMPTWATMTGISSPSETVPAPNTCLILLPVTSSDLFHGGGTAVNSGDGGLFGGGATNGSAAGAPGGAFGGGAGGVTGSSAGGAGGLGGGGGGGGSSAGAAGPGYACIGEAILP